jgi:hypothetical protein
LPGLVESLEQRRLLSVAYDFDLIVDAGFHGLSSLGRSPSVNDNGYVAYLGRRTVGEKEIDNIFAHDPLTHESTRLMSPLFEHPRTGDVPRQEFSETLQIDNSNQVMAWRYLTAKVQVGFPFGEILDMPLTYWERWSASGQNSAGQIGVPESQVVMGDAGIGPAAPLLYFINPSNADEEPTPFAQYGFDAVQRWGSISNYGQVAFGAIIGSSNVRVTGPHSNPRFLGGGVSFDYKPVIADSGDVVFSSGSRLYVESFNFVSLTEIVGPAKGFSQIGANPAITDDGKVVTFHAVLSTAGANALNIAQASFDDEFGSPLGVVPVTPGSGVFIAAKSPAGWIIQRIAGVAGNGVLDPGETFIDTNGNGFLDGAEIDRGVITGFEADSRAAVAATGDSLQLTRVVFTPFTGGSGHALLSADVFVQRGNSAAPTGNFDPVKQQIIALPGQTIPLSGGSERTVLDVSIGDPLSRNGQIAFWVNTTQGEAILRAAPILRPVLIFPGIGGVFPAAEDYNRWFINRGFDPQDLLIDPLAHLYDNLIQSFINAGYRLGENLFAATYDWRLNPGPVDGNFDGHLSGLSASSITAADSTGEFRYGVDYLGYWLKQAMERWEVAHPGLPLDSVDMIGHSTGGLVIRSYIQSDAYNGVFDGNRRLPRVNTFVMYDVPNRGAPKAWSFLNNDWLIDFPDPTYPVVFRGTMNGAFQKVINGGTISGGDYDITLADLVPGSNQHREQWRNQYRDSRSDPDTVAEPADAEAVRRKFIQLYVPTVRSLLSTDDFLIRNQAFTNVNDDPNFRNNLALDLNGGVDPNAFASQVDQVVNVWGNGVQTILGNEQRIGATSQPFSEGLILPMDRKIPRRPRPGEIWYKPVQALGGDGTVPYISLATPFLSDPRFVNREFVTDPAFRTPLLGSWSIVTLDDVSHNGVLSNRWAQHEIISLLGIDVPFASIAHEEFSTEYLAAVELMLDPVSAYVVDPQGRRLGFRQGEGALAEIPGSVFLGGADGFGFIQGDAAGPYELVIEGRGDDYFVQLNGRSGGAFTGTSIGGVLSNGQTVRLSVPAATILNDQTAIAADDGVTTPLNATVRVPILANDLTTAGFDLGSILIVDAPDHGTASFDSARGELVYTPAAGYLGADSIRYSVASLGGVRSNQATVQIQVVPDTTPPIVLQSDFDYQSAPNLVKIRFSENVAASLAPADLVLQNLTNPGVVPAWTLAYDSLTNIASMGFAGVVPDGRYQLTLAAGAVADPAGNTLTSSSVFSFFSLAGDANHDAIVDIADLGILATNWQQSPRDYFQGDFNYDGSVDVADLGILATNWQKSLGATGFARDSIVGAAMATNPPFQIRANILSSSRSSGGVLSAIEELR